MRDFFSLEGPFNRYGGMVADMIILSLLWLFFSIIGLGITAGASTSAMFYVTTRRIANREGYVTSDFWEAFKANLKRATILWIMMVLILGLLWFNLNNLQLVGGMSVVILPAQIIIFIQVVLISIYAFPMCARFDMSVRQILRSCFFMANRHLLTSISCALLLLAAFLTFGIMPPLAIFLAPGAYAMLSSYMIMKIFKKYRPEMDKDPILEIQEIEAEKAEERRRQRIGYITDAAEVVEETEEPIDDIVAIVKQRESEPQILREKKPPAEPVKKADFWDDVEEEYELDTEGESENEN